jgi:hypothetical protein
MQDVGVAVATLVELETVGKTPVPVGNDVEPDANGLSDVLFMKIAEEDDTGNGPSLPVASETLGLVLGRLLISVVNGTETEVEDGFPLSVKDAEDDPEAITGLSSVLFGNGVETKDAPIDVSTPVAPNDGEIVAEAESVLLGNRTDDDGARLLVRSVTAVPVNPVPTGSPVDIATPVAPNDDDVIEEAVDSVLFGNSTDEDGSRLLAKPVTEVPVIPVPTGPVAELSKQELLLFVSGGEGDAIVVTIPVPALMDPVPVVGPEERVLLLIGNGGEDACPAVEVPVPVGPVGPEKRVLLLIGNGGEDDCPSTDVPVPVGPVDPEKRVLLLIGNGGEDVGSVGMPVPVVSVGPAKVVLLLIGNGGEDGCSVVEVPVPANPVPVGPAEGPRGDVLLDNGNGGEDGSPVAEVPVPVDPLGPEKRVLLLIGNGGEVGCPVVEAPVPVPVSPVPVGPASGPGADVLLLIGNGGEVGCPVAEAPVPVPVNPVPVNPVPVGPASGSGADVLLDNGNGGEDCSTEAEVPVPVTVPVEPLGPERRVLLLIGNGGDVGCPVVEASVPGNSIPVGPASGSGADVLLDNGNGGEKDGTEE